NHLVPAVELNVLDKQQGGVGRDGAQQHSPETAIAMGTRHDHVKDDGFVNEVGENARKGHETAGFRIAEGEDQVRVVHGAADVVQLAAAAPPFVLVHAPELLDLAAGEAGHELRRVYVQRDHGACCGLRK